MKAISGRDRFCLWLLVLAGLTLASLAGPPPVSAGVGQSDHLVCFDVVRDPRPEGTTRDISLDTDLPSTEAGCYIRNKIEHLCVKASKNNEDDSRGGLLFVDYACYALVCPNPVTREFDVNDQFNAQSIKTRSTRWLCAPSTD